MIANFVQDLYKKLIQSGFNSIKSFYHTDIIDESTKYVGLLKQEGSLWYAVIIFNMDLINMSEFLSINNDHTKFFTELQSKFKFRSVVITNIMLSEEPKLDINSFINSLELFLEQNVNNVYWNLNMVDGQMVLNKNHPTQILNLRKILDESYTSVRPRLNYHNYGKTFSQLQELAYEECPYKKIQRRPYLTYIIILVNLLVISIIELNGGSTNVNNLIRFGAIEPNAIIYDKEYYRLFTAIFIHVGFTHLAYNTLALYIFGTRAEKYYGRFNFILIYILGGLIGSIFSLAFTRGLSAGASGAIFSVVGAVAVISKKVGRDIEGVNYYSMLMYILISISFGFLVPNIDNYGHLGGLLGGTLISYRICKYLKYN